MDLCIVCLTKKPNENVINEPKLSSIKNLLSISRERHRYGDHAEAVFVSRTKEQIGPDIINKKEKHQRFCYRDCTTKRKNSQQKTKTKMHSD